MNNVGKPIIELEKEYIETNQKLHKLNNKLKRLKKDILTISNYTTFEYITIIKSKRKVVDINKLKENGIYNNYLKEQEIIIIKIAGGNQ